MEQESIFVLNLSPNFEEFLKDISSLQINPDDVSILRELSNNDVSMIPCFQKLTFDNLK